MIASATTSSVPATETSKEEKNTPTETTAANSIMDTLEKSDQEVSFKEEEETNIEKIESCVEDLFRKLHAQFNDSQSILKTLASNLKILHKEVQKEKKELIKNRKKKTSVSGFAKPSRISEKLAEFLEVPKEELIARTDATRMVLDYIKKKELQNPDYKKQILPDEKLRNLLEPHFTHEDKLEYFNIQKYLKYHFLKE